MFAPKLPLIASFVILAGVSTAESREIGSVGHSSPLPYEEPANAEPPKVEPLPIHIPGAQMANLAAALAPVSSIEASKLEASPSCLTWKSVICIKDGRVVPSVIERDD